MMFLYVRLAMSSEVSEEGIHVLEDSITEKWSYHLEGQNTHALGIGRRCFYIRYDSAEDEVKMLPSTSTKIAHCLGTVTYLARLSNTSNDPKSRVETN